MICDAAADNVFLFASSCAWRHLRMPPWVLSGVRRLPLQRHGIRPTPVLPKIPEDTTFSSQNRPCRCRTELGQGPGTDRIQESDVRDGVVTLVSSQLLIPQLQLAFAAAILPRTGKVCLLLHPCAPFAIWGNTPCSTMPSSFWPSPRLPASSDSLAWLTRRPASPRFSSSSCSFSFHSSPVAGHDRGQHFPDHTEYLARKVPRALRTANRTAPIN